MTTFNIDPSKRLVDEVHQAAHMNRLPVIAGAADTVLKLANRSLSKNYPDGPA